MSRLLDVMWLGAVAFDSQIGLIIIFTNLRVVESNHGLLFGLIKIVLFGIHCEANTITLSLNGSQDSSDDVGRVEKYQSVLATSLFNSERILYLHNTDTQKGKCPQFAPELWNGCLKRLAIA
jgi:hypothetical protein